MARVFEFVKREAARYGVAVQSSEIVGLVPKRAIEDAAEWFLQVENFDSSLILENRLAAVMGGKSAVGGLRAGVEPFLAQLAAPTAVPGGGSASAAAGAMAAGLAAMVAGMSRGKKAYAEFEAELSAALAKLAALGEELKASIDTRRSILPGGGGCLQGTEEQRRRSRPARPAEAGGGGAAWSRQRAAARGRVRRRGRSADRALAHARRIRRWRAT